MKQYRSLPLVFALSICLVYLTACGVTPPPGSRAVTATPTLVPGDYERTVKVGGLERTYRLHVPPGLDNSGPLAVVFLFHGYGSSAAAFMPPGMLEKADTSGFLVVRPDGTGSSNGRSWNAGGCCGYASNNGVDEPAFIRSILADLAGITNMDPARIYAAGHSNGGMLVYRLACDMADTFAAVASVAGPLFDSTCQPSAAVSILHIHGINDPIVPFDGGGSAIPGGFPSVEESITTWAGLDGCTETPQVTEIDVRITHTAHAGCLNGTSVELYAIAAHEHPWPVNAILPTADVIWSFFETHPRQIP